MLLGRHSACTLSRGSPCRRSVDSSVGRSAHERRQRVHQSCPSQPGSTSAGRPAPEAPWRRSGAAAPPRHPSGASGCLLCRDIVTIRPPTRRRSCPGVPVDRRSWWRGCTSARMAPLLPILRGRGAWRVGWEQAVGVGRGRPVAGHHRGAVRVQTRGGQHFGLTQRPVRAATRDTTSGDLAPACQLIAGCGVGGARLHVWHHSCRSCPAGAEQGGAGERGGGRQAGWVGGGRGTQGRRAGTVGVGSGRSGWSGRASQPTLAADGRWGAARPGDPAEPRPGVVPGCPDRRALRELRLSAACTQAVEHLRCRP